MLEGKAPYTGSTIDESRHSRVLIVEDNTVNSLVLKTILENASHTVVAVSDGHAAIEAAENDTFDVILMDIEMPVLDGLEATRRIREKLQDSAPPIIAITAHNTNSDRRHLLESGLDDYISKPFDQNLVLQTLHRAVSGSTI